MRIVEYNVQFSDFEFLQGHMSRRVYALNKNSYGMALFSVVACAVFIAFAILINLQPWLVSELFRLPYPQGVYVALILCLLLAIFSLIPAIKLRTRTLRLQVSDNGPLLGPTRFSIEEDGVIIDRDLMTAKYKWAALRGVEIAKNALVIPVDAGMGIIIPASAFPDDTARYAFAAALSERIDQAKNS